MVARIDLPTDHLTDYERAICYHTLPHVTHPLTFGLIVAYGVCLLEAVGMLVYGLAASNLFVAQIGSIAVYAVVAFGVAIFLLRALFNEVRKRRMLAAAEGVPDAAEDDSGEIPDPFAGHLLLQHPTWTQGDLFPCTDNDGNLVFFVETSAHRPHYRIKDPQDNEVLRVDVLSGQSSFTLGGAGPSRVAAYEGDAQVARIIRRFSFTSPVYLIESVGDGQRKYRIQQGNIYRDKDLVGRIYTLRQSLYLDIREEEFSKGMLGLFVTMT